MNDAVSLLIQFYIFICIALLFYNVYYILHFKLQKWREMRKTKKWLRIIRTQCEILSVRRTLMPTHLHLLERKLKKIDVLVAYHNAVVQAMSEQETASRMPYYLDLCSVTYQTLALAYRKRPPMERAFMAHLLSIYRPNIQKAEQLPEILLSYFDRSTIFCRENILKALYATGQSSAVIQALSLLNDQGFYHHPRLISDGLSSFTGNKSQLAAQLWKRCSAWNEQLQVAVVQFATNLSREFSNDFLAALCDKNTPLETRFALIRYFQRWRYPTARAVLLELLRYEDVFGGGLSISAAAALSNYPGATVRNALRKALHSRNWHVRRNAAASLVSLGGSYHDVDLLREEGDVYAAEMLEYTLESSGVSRHEPKEAKA